MEDIFKNLPQHTCSWSKGRAIMYKYQGFWNDREFHKGAILAQLHFKAQPSDVLLCSCPKTGTTWLKALAFSIVTRKKFDVSTSPLLTTLPHNCIPFLEKHFNQILKKRENPLVGTHLPYGSLPKSVFDLKCKIVYIYRNIKDVMVSHYHYLRELANLSMEEAPFEEAFNEFCEGFSYYGPYWDHILGYWKAYLENPKNILFIKYEDLKRDSINNVKRLAEFIGYPFSTEEIKEGMVEKIINLCSFENLSNLEVNKNGMHHLIDASPIKNRYYFRKAKDGDWKNYFTHEMIENIDMLINQKLNGTGLVLTGPISRM
uniref:flavonol sulfotransferase-like n=1 Tax=Erigeron canadensis TaxID=72917 RepID=UPI001CB8FF00|nr:flavonol sulfotransferase-like [Erigeron canadensis]